MPSERSARAPSRTALGVRLQERVAAGEPVLDLTRTNPTTLGIPYDEPAIRSALSDPAILWHAYDPRGDRTARDALAAHYASRGAAIDGERIVLTSGTRQARALLALALTDPGDELLALTPARPLLDELAALASVHVARCPRSFDGERWSIDARALWDRATERTRALWLGSPSDPTGDALDADAVVAIAELGVPAVIEESLAPCPLDAEEIASALGHDRDAALVSIGSLGGLAGLPQLGLAWIAVGGDSAVAEPLLERLASVADTLRAPSAPAERAIPALLASAHVARDAMAQRCRANLAALRARGLDVPRVDGGWIAPIRLPRDRRSEATSLALLDRGVLVTPGESLEFPENPGWIAVSLLTPAHELAHGAELILAL